MMEASNKEKTIKILKNSGQYLLFFLVSIIMISSILMLCKISISKYHFAMSAIVSFIPFYFLNKKERTYELVISIVLSFFVIMSSMYINSKYIDLSWDGNTYHKDAVGIMKNGWNPIYDDYIEFYKKLNNRDMEFIGTKIENTHGFWQTYYAKATWQIGATFYIITEDIETGKAYNLIIVYTTFVLALSMLYNIRKKILPSLIIAALLAFNPISAAQMFTYYNDGLLCNLLLLVIFYMTIFTSESNKMSKKELYFILCSILLFLINIKFTGFGYAGIFCAFYYLIYILKKYKAKELKEILKPTIIFATTVIVSVCFIGFSPYITNMLDKKPIFYPLMGKEKVDIVSYNQPVQFETKSTLFKFAKSTLSETSNINNVSGLKPKTKLPFTVEQHELDILYHPDLRIAGFGPLFSGILIISSIIISIIGLIMIIKKAKEVIYIIIPIIVTILLILLITESWWARYTPYLYIIPIIALVLTMISDKKISKLLFVFVALPMVMNMNYFIEYNIKANYEESKEVIKRLDSLKNKKITVIDTFDRFIGVLYNLDDRKIEYTIQSERKANSKEFYKWIEYIEGDE